MLLLDIRGGANLVAKRAHSADLFTEFKEHYIDLGVILVIWHATGGASYSV